MCIPLKAFTCLMYACSTEKKKKGFKLSSVIEAKNAEITK